MDISKKPGVSRPYIALFGPKKGDIENSPWFIQFYNALPLKRRYRAVFRGLIRCISLHFSVLAWPDPKTLVII
jgi:hypothetical protein